MHYLIPLLFITVACGLKQPVGTDHTATATGLLYVTSDTLGATIFLDGVNTTKQTPDTLKNIPAGFHVVSLFKNGFRVSPDSLEVEVFENRITSAHFFMEKLIRTGTLHISSEPGRAEIFIDNQPSGAFTPDSISLETGSYRIELRKNGYLPEIMDVQILPDSVVQITHTLTVQKRVLLESFANVSCEPCVEATEILENFVTEHAEVPGRFAIIEYFANWPLASDPFYQQAPDDVDSRLATYSIYTRGLPSLQINGVQETDPVNAEEMNSTFENSYTTLTGQTGLSIEKVLEENTLKTRVEVYNDGSGSTVDLGSFRLFLAVTENEIVFDEAPGSNGLTHFNFVFRGFVTDREGLVLSGEENPQVFEYSTAWPGNWNYSNSHLVGFLQHTETKRIIQASIN